MPQPTDEDKGTDDVSGAARPLLADHPGDTPPSDPDGPGGAEELEGAAGADEANLPGPDAEGPPPPQVEELAAACVRFIAARYGTTLDYEADTLSFVDQWVRDGRVEVVGKREAADLVQAAAGAYLGEVVRRCFGARWVAEGEHASWKLCLSNVYCSFNPIGMVREALLLEPAEGWHAHLELDPGEREAVEARLAALPQADDDEFYAPTTRFDVLCILVDALRASMRARGLGDVRFSADDYK